MLAPSAMEGCVWGGEGVEEPGAEPAAFRYSQNCTHCALDTQDEEGYKTHILRKQLKYFRMVS